MRTFHLVYSVLILVFAFGCAVSQKAPCAQNAPKKSQFEFYQRMVAANPGNACVLGKLIRATIDEGRHAEAHDALAQLKKLDPDGYRYAHGMGRLALKENDLVTAERWLRKAVLIDPQGGDYLYLAQIAGRRGNAHEEIEYYRQALKFYRSEESGSASNGYYWFFRGMVEEHLKLHSEAVVSYQQASILLPDKPEVLWRLGIQLESSGRMDEALTIYGRFLEINKPSDKFWIRHKGKVQAKINALQPGNYAKTDHSGRELKGTEATECDLKPHNLSRRKTKVAIALVIDSSASMRRHVNWKCYKSVYPALVDQLLDEDELTVVSAYIAPSVELKLQPIGKDRGAITNRLALINSWGTTKLFPGLETAYEMLSKSDYRTRHLVVVTDGNVPDAGRKYIETAARMKKKGITLSSIKLGPSEDYGFLATLAASGGGTSYEAQSEKGLLNNVIEDIDRIASENSGHS